MAILINQKDCLTARKNLGLSDCILSEGRLQGFILVPRGWELDLATDSFDKDYVQSQIQLGNFVPVLGSVESTNATPEPTIEEFQGGIKSVVRNGLPEFTFKFIKGWKWSNALYSYNSFQAFDVLFTFSSGAIAGGSDGTKLSGFSAGMINSNSYLFTDGTNSSSVTAMMQLTSETEFNSQVALLDASVLDFNINQDISPITDIVMTGRADVSDSKIYFTAKFAMNQSQDLMGIAIANIKSYVNGVADVITPVSLVFDPVLREYSFTPTAVLATTDKVVVSLYDSLASVDTAKIGNKLYKGKTGDVIPVA